MYQAKVDRGFIIAPAILEALIFLLAVAILSCSAIPKPEIILIFSSFVAVFAPLTELTFLVGIKSAKNKSGVPLITPKDYLDKDLVFHLINEEENLCLITLTAANGPVAAISLLDFAPDDRKEIKAQLQRSFDQERRLKLTAYGVQLRQGFLFVLGHKPSEEKPEVAEGTIASDNMENSVN